MWTFRLLLLSLSLSTVLASSQLHGQGSESDSPDFKGLDIGDVGEAGSTSFDDKTGQYTIAGSGADIYNSSDQFHYAHVAWSGDGQIVARVSGVSDTNGNAKAGVMFRETLDADSANAVMEIKASTGSEFQYRERTAAKTSYNGTNGIKAPYFVRLVRRGNTFTGYRSTDGKNWILQSSASVPMKKEIYVGLSVTAHNNEALNTSTFDKVKISSKLPPAPKPINIKGSTGVTGFIPLLTAETFDPLTDDGQDPAKFQSDLDEFYTYRNSAGVDKGHDEDEGKKETDDDVVFRLTPNGELHILGVPNEGQTEPFGYISTKDNYRNYHLSLEYKWGKEKFAPRNNTVRDSGLLYHVPKPDDEVWTDSVETQIQERDTGDFHFLWGGDRMRGTVTVTPGAKRYQPAGETIKDSGDRIIKSKTVDSLTEWNQVEVIIEQDDVTVIVNGVVVNRASDMKIPVQDQLIPLTEGKIQLQAEGAEIFYRNVKLKPIHAVGGRGDYKVLLFEETADNPQDDLQRGPTVKEAISSLGKANGFTVDVAGDSQGVFTKDNLQQYAAVVWNASGSVLDKSEQAAFESYIQSGGGFVGLPSAALSGAQWTWFGDLVATSAEQKNAQQVMTLKVDPEASIDAGGSGLHHPAVDSLPLEWKRNDIWHSYRDNPRSKVNVLLTVEGDADQPIAWWHDYDGGRSFFTGVGHFQQSHHEPLYLTHLLGGIEYAAGVSRVRPADAVVLFDGSNTDAFEKEKGGGKIGWKIDQDGNLAIVPGTGYFVQTTESFTDYRLHLEFKLPATAPGTPEQKRGNSGLYLHRSYELQLLDSYNVPKFDWQHIGSIYAQKEANSNAGLPAETWQVYDIDFTAPRFDEAGTKTANARITAYLNGVLIHDDVEIEKPTAVGKPETPGAKPFMLQDHDPNSKLKFRNIWLQPTS